MHAADTNVLLREFVQDDPAQLAAAGAFVRRGAWVSHVVLAEFAWALESVYGRPAPAIADTVELLLDHQSLVVQDDDVVAAALAGFRAKPGVSFPDHLILAIARKAGHLPLGTFDRRLGKLDGAQAL